jgi:diguanylate cyclase
MEEARKVESSIYKNKRWIMLFFYVEIIITVLNFTLINKSTSPMRIILYFSVGAIVSNLIVFYLSGEIMKVYSIVEKLKVEANKDYLTGLNNVRSFDKSFNEILVKAKNNDESIGLLSIDVDFFKKVNDTYGHSSGDIVLKELSDILSKSVRDFDVVGRVGGEEFSVILRDCGQDRSCEIAERIRKNVEKYIFRLTSDTSIKITVSIGISVYPATIADMNLLKEKADQKLYEAKLSGRNKACI